MCGRYLLTTPVDALAQLFRFSERPNLGPRYNIAPTQDVPIVRLSREGDRRELIPELIPELIMVRWGLVPYWADDPKIGNGRSTPAPRRSSARPRPRGLPAPPLPGAGGWLLRMAQAGRAAAAAADPAPGPGAVRLRGLWERWKQPDGGVLRSCTIVTCPPNALVAPIHDRMPVILAQDDHAAWLDPEEGGLELLRPCPPDWLEAIAVSPRVNNPANDDPECIAPVVDAIEQPRLIRSASAPGARPAGSAAPSFHPRLLCHGTVAWPYRPANAVSRLGGGGVEADGGGKGQNDLATYRTHVRPGTKAGARCRAASRRRDRAQAPGSAGCLEGDLRGTRDMRQSDRPLAAAAGFENVYYDTADQRLRARGLAFRVRRDGRRYVQTLKSGGCRRAGRLYRGEWQTPLGSADPDLGLLPSEASQVLDGLVTQGDLRSLFTTRVRRQPAGSRPPATAVRRA